MYDSEVMCRKKWIPPGISRFYGTNIVLRNFLLGTLNNFIKRLELKDTDNWAKDFFSCDLHVISYICEANENG